MAFDSDHTAPLVPVDNLGHMALMNSILCRECLLRYVSTLPALANLSHGVVVQTRQIFARAALLLKTVAIVICGGPNKQMVGIHTPRIVTAMAQILGPGKRLFVAEFISKTVRPLRRPTGTFLDRDCSVAEPVFRARPFPTAAPVCRWNDMTPEIDDAIHHLRTHISNYRTAKVANGTL